MNANGESPISLNSFLLDVNQIFINKYFYRTDACMHVVSNRNQGDSTNNECLLINGNHNELISLIIYVTMSSTSNNNKKCGLFLYTAL